MRPSQPPVGPKRSVLMRCGSCPSSTSAAATASTNGVGPQTKTCGCSVEAGPTSREHLGVDPARVAGPSGGLRARQRVDDVEPAARQALELVAVDDVVPAARRVEQAHVGVAARPPRAGGSSPSAARRPSHRRRAAPARRPRAPRRSSRRSGRAARSGPRDGARRSGTARPRRRRGARPSARRGARSGADAIE